MPIGLQLLLVHSNAKLREKLKAFVGENSQYDIIEAHDGKFAASVLKTENIACVISDIDIGQLDGWRLVRLVRSGVFNCKADTPFIMLASTWCERIAETTAREFGINHILPYENYHQIPHLLSHYQTITSHLIQNKILVIEDAEDTADLVYRMLRHKFTVEIAQDGTQGLAMWQADNYDIVLLDIMLPGMSGTEVLDQILLQKPDQTVVVMTAHGSMDLAEELMFRGACDFISKPFRAEQLRKVIDIAARRDDFLVSNAQFAQTITTLKTNETAKNSIAQAHQRLLDNLTTSVLELDGKGRIRFVNQSWLNLTGYTCEQALNLCLSHFLSESCSLNSYQSALDKLMAGDLEKEKLELRLKHRKEKEHWVEARFNRICDKKNKVTISVTIDDITTRKLAEEKLAYQALHDPLTQLHNRHYFDQKLIEFTLLAQRQQKQHALLYLDLDHFKAINDTQGHSQGDLVLADISEQLKNKLRKSDILCRIGGDEFAILLPYTELEAAKSLADNICKDVASGHFQFDEKIYKVTCSVGVSIIDGLEKSAQTYLQRADIALYVAKGQGRNQVHCFTSDDKESDEFQSNMQWIHILHYALENDHLEMHYQPVVDIKTQEIAYYEALVRLNVEGKLIYPNEFIPTLEKFDDMNLLDHHVVNCALKDLANYPELKRIAINLSAQAFRDKRLLPLIEGTLKTFNVEPQRVIFELTESASLSNLSATQNMIERLSDLGCDFSIDDFGTGFSTFAYLKNLPADTVKIDGSFVKEMLHNKIDLALVKAICEVAGALNKKTVAEFVESEAILDLLSDINVDYAQGYFLGKPQALSVLFPLKEDNLSLA
ncbi:GGDEF/EAL domain-containing response regulator [Pseudoalteromonas denitrificans]|uniref:PAS domain S-box-containing protein/diguanylate cyclase (GGDEF) domain-containing protein n=1 Tax=Pseudoalteromonas denitrificans DSM 6059 TaxID=1123010 RepID=A0A1I1RQ14_9GAMM|nr:EAL domain-containing protein [Pseudoalteromonas denitrificans]SFD36439.1 PAS domain S-box-containing protein/diguanylate cyclase (GGDEF) domain-containing protein [Pseudoalteromonas denitrificans DSM 6059]